MMLTEYHYVYPYYRQCIVHTLTAIRIYFNEIQIPYISLEAAVC